MASAREECLLGVHFQVLGGEGGGGGPCCPGGKGSFLLYSPQPKSNVTTRLKPESQSRETESDFAA